MGNKRSKEIWEYKVLPEYEQPQPSSTREVKDRWINAKYNQRLFADPDIIKPDDFERPPVESVKLSTAPSKEGFLIKQGPKEEIIRSWKQRWFILKDNTLYYYVSREDSIPAGVIRLSGSTVRVSGTAAKQNSFEIVIPGRVHIISAEDSSDMASWIQVIKQSISFFENGGQAQATDVEPERLSQEDIHIRRKTVMLKQNEIKRKGYLFKKGNNLIKDWKKRWVVLYKLSLYYYEDEGQALPLGIIELDSQCQAPVCHRNSKHKRFEFELLTTQRTYFFYSEDQEEASEWAFQLQDTIHEAQGKQQVSCTSYQPLPQFDESFLGNQQEGKNDEALGLSPSPPHTPRSLSISDRFSRGLM